MKWLAIAFVLLIGLNGFSQNSSSVRIGAGVVSLGSRYGVSGNTELLFPLSKDFSYGLTIGYAMISDKMISTTEAGAFNQLSLSLGDLCISYNPKVFKKLILMLKGSGGLRHINSTQLLVNSSLEITPTNERYTNIGLQLGIGLDYRITDNSFLGFQYLHDFYKEGFDYFGFRIGFNLKLNE